MRVSIDRTGRLVIPKPVRAELGLEDGGEVEVSTREGRIEIEPISTPVRLVERDGFLAAESEHEGPPLTVDAVRDLLERSRR